MIPTLNDKEEEFSHIGLFLSENTFSCSPVSYADVEMVQCLPILGKLLRQELQGHMTASSGVLGLVDHTHSTFSKLLQNCVMADGFADHGTPPSWVLNPRPPSSSRRSIWAEEQRAYFLLHSDVEWRPVLMNFFPLASLFD